MTQLLGVSTLAYEGYGLDVALRELHRLGVTCVEPAFVPGYADHAEAWEFSPREARALRHTLAAYGQCSVAVSAHVDLGAEEAVSAFRRRMEFAREVGASIINTNAARKADEATFLRNITELVCHAETLGLTIALENPGNGEGNLIGSGEEGAALVQRIGSAHVRLNYDVGNVLSYSRGRMQPAEDLKHALPFAVHLHCKDPKREAGGWSFGAIGEGAVDYDEVLGLLAKAAERPAISLELPLSMTWKTGPAPRVEARLPELAEIGATVARSVSFVSRYLGGAVASR